MKNYNLNLREKFEPGAGFEPRTSNFNQCIFEIINIDLKSDDRIPQTIQ